MQYLLVILAIVQLSDACNAPQGSSPSSATASDSSSGRRRYVRCHNRWGHFQSCEAEGSRNCYRQSKHRVYDDINDCQLNDLIPDSCLAYYPLMCNYGANDTSGNDYDGVIEETISKPTDSPFAAIPFQGLEFYTPVTQTRVKVDASSTPLATLGSASFTISLYAKLTVEQSTAPLLEYSFSEFGTVRNYPFGLHLFFYPSSNTIYFQAIACDSASYSASVNCATDGAAEWHFISAIYNATDNTIQAFCGSQASSVVTLGVGCSPLSTDLFYLGHRAANTGKFTPYDLQGRMACVSICQEAMTQTQLTNMQSICQRFFNKPCNN